jgi:hypothetical protein
LGTIVYSTRGTYKREANFAVDEVFPSKYFTKTIPSNKRITNTTYYLRHLEMMGLQGDSSSTTVYFEDGSGGYTSEIINEDPHNFIGAGGAAANSAIDYSYSPLVISTDGALWDLGMLRLNEDATINSFVSAFVTMNIRVHTSVVPLSLLVLWLFSSSTAFQSEIKSHSQKKSNAVGDPDGDGDGDGDDSESESSEYSEEWEELEEFDGHDEVDQQQLDHQVQIEVEVVEEDNEDDKHTAKKAGGGGVGVLECVWVA